MRAALVAAIVCLMLPSAFAKDPAPKKALTSDEINAMAVQTFGGAKKHLKDFRAKATLISIWTDSCGPCLAELPLLQKLADSYAGDHDVSIVALSFDPTGQHTATPTDEARKVAKRLALTIPLLWDTGFGFMELANGNELSFPTSFLIDRAGNIVQETGFDAKTASTFVATKRTLIDAAKKR